MPPSYQMHSVAEALLIMICPLVVIIVRPRGVLVALAIEEPRPWHGDGAGTRPAHSPLRRGPRQHERMERSVSQRP